MLAKITNFITTDIWRIRLRTLSRRKSFLIKPVMITLLAVRGFDEDKCQLRASALTYYTLLSIVPILAMVFGIAKGFGIEHMLEKLLLEKLPGQQEVVSQTITFARSLLENTKGGVIAGIGVVLLFWTVIKVLGNIEKSFNEIWGIKKARSLTRKFSDYLSITLICPVLFVMASSATVFISSQVKLILEKIAFLGAFGPLIMTALNMLPYVVVWVLFTFIYLFMPNTGVQFKSGILAGIVAGTLYQVVQLVYINFQIGVAKYNAIYGSFAALPLFLVWLQTSWLIVLFGAELSFASQNLETYELEPDCLRISYSFKKLLTLRMMHFLVKNFCRGERPQTATQISHELEVPIRLARQILYELVEVGLVSELKAEDDRAIAFQPGRCAHDLTVKDILDALEDKGTDNLPVKRTAELEKLSAALTTFKTMIEKSPANARLEEI